MNEFEIKNGWLRVWGQYEELHIKAAAINNYRYSEVADMRSEFLLSNGDRWFSLPLETGRKLLEQLYVAVRQDDCC